MMMIVSVITLLLPSVVLSQVVPEVVNQPPPPNYYTVAIFEHARLGNWTTETPAQIINTNLDYYKRATEVAKSQGADIIAFPEYGLFPLLDREAMKMYLETIPDPKKGNWNPCIQKQLFSNSPMLYTLSCMASQNRIAVLANIGDIQSCETEDYDNCPEDGSWHYNANVVFDRDGTIISRYRKEYLFFERGMDLPEERQDPIFKTDFGTFAGFICFDIIFKHIAEAAQDSQVDSVFLSTMWVEIMPVMSSLQYFQGWALGHKTTFIAANGQIPGFAAVGSGVFTAEMGPLISTFNPDGRSKLLVSRVPKSKNQTWPFPNPEASVTIITSNGTEPYDEMDTDFENYLPEYCAISVVGAAKDKYKDYRCVYERTVNYTLVKLTEPSGYLEACNNGMCCSLDYDTEGLNDTFYFGVGNITHNSFDRYYWCAEKCLVVRCESFNGTECSKFPTKSSTTFQTLRLRSNFTTPYVYPSVVQTGLRLSPMKDWNYDVQSEGTNYEGSLVYTSPSEKKPLLVAALNSRCYDRDPPYIR